MTRIGTAGQRGTVAGQLSLEGMPERLYPCTPTRLNVFRGCPMRYRMLYLDPPTPGRRAWAHLSLGASAHSALAQWWALAPAHRTPQAGASLTRKVWIDKGFRDANQSAQVRERVAGWVGRYLAQIDAAVEPVAVERTVAVRTPTMTISGRVDRVDRRTHPERGDELVVVDYKTGSTAPDDHTAGTSLQLALYSLAVERTLRRPVARAELHHLPSGTVVGVDHDNRARESFVAQAAAIARECAQADDAYRELGVQGSAEFFPPRPSSGCGSCDMRAMCAPGQAAAPELPPWGLLATEDGPR